MVDNILKILQPIIPSEIKIEGHFNKNIPAVNSHPTNFNKVIMNLIINTKEAINNEGVISVSIENV